MRLGAYPAELKKGTIAERVYGKTKISERHRHRYEVNNQYRPVLEEKGMVFGGINPELKLVEMIEIKDHPWFLGCQFHPEFKSKPFQPHPLFVGFVKAALKHTMPKITKTPLHHKMTKRLKGSVGLRASR